MAVTKVGKDPTGKDTNKAGREFFHDDGAGLMRRLQDAVKTKKLGEVREAA